MSNSDWNKVATFHLIKAKTELHEKLNQLTKDNMMIELLTEPVLFEYVSPRESRLAPELHRIKVKILFLAQLYNDYVFSNSEDEVCSIVTELLKSFPIQHEVFDKWWEVSSLGVPENSEEIIKELDTETLGQIAPTGTEAIDEWLAYLIKHKA